MEKPINRPKPVFKLEHSENCYENYYILDTHDSMPMNSSTNYDHHYEGAGLIVVKKQSGMTQKNEWYVNSPEPWEYVGALAQLGINAINKGIFTEEELEELMEKMKSLKPVRSIHDKKKEDDKSS